MEFLNQNMHTIITAAVILVALLIAVAVWRAFSPRVSGGRRGQRLGISEYYELDKDRRLVIVRRDGVEHLVLIGGPQDIVIETNIGGAPAAGTARPAPRGALFTERTTAPLRTAPEPAAPRPREEPEL